ncbi:MAG: beta strand repeat-containing protein [Candidatus Coprovivens sp.]
MKKFILFLFLLFIPFLVSAENELILKSVVPNYDTSQQILVNNPSGVEDFNLTLTDKEQEISYYVTIQNTSDTNVKIDEINLSNPDVEYLEYSYSSLEVDNIIEANSSRIMLLTIKSNDIGELNDTNNFQLELKYSKTNLISGGEINGGGSSSNSPNNPNSGNNNSGNNGNNSNENGNDTDREEDVKNPNTYSDVVIFFALLISGILLLYFVKKKNKKTIIIILFILGTTLFNCVFADEVVEQDSLTITGLINFGKIPNKTYTIEIDPNGGLFNGVDVPYKALVLYNTKIDLSDVYREYFDFKYWTYNDEIQYMESTISVVEDIRLEAVWKEHPTYALTINPNGGLYENESTFEVRLHEGERYELKDPVRTSYLFVAWNENEDEGYLKDDVVTMGKKDIEVSAEWIREEDIVAKIPESNRYYQTIQRALVEVKDGQTVVVLKDVDESFTNEKKVKLDLNGHKVVGKLVNKGDIVIDNGIIENTNGIAVSNTGILTLGVNDKNDDAKPNVSQDSVAIIGTTVGIEQYGTFYFYDGYIEGDVTINGSVHATPVDYATFVDHNGEKDCQKAYLISQNNIDRAVSKTIVNGEIYYFNLQDSINTAKYSGFDIYAVRDFEAAYKLTIDKNVTIVFDINGYNITTGTDVKNNGTFIIRDTSDEKGRIIPAITVVNNGILNLNDATIETNDTINVITNNGIINATNSVVKAKSGYAIYNNDGTINADENTYFKANSYAFYNNSSKEAKLTSGNYEGIYNTKTLVIDGANVKMSKTESLTGVYNSGTLTINSGIIDVEIVQNGYAYVYGIQNISVLNMNGGEIKVTHTCVNNVDCSSYQKYAYGIYSNSSNSSILTGLNKAKINSSGTGIYHYYGTVNVEESNIISGSSGIYSSFSNVNLLNTDITSQTDAFYCSLNNRSSRSVNIIGGTLTAGNYGVYLDGYYYTSSSVYYVNAKIGDKDNKTVINSNSTGIYLNDYTNTNILNADIKSSNSNGVYLYAETNTLTIGENDLNISQVSPLVMGETYGVNVNAGSLNFYDGLIKGKTNAIKGSVTAIPSASIVSTNYEVIDNYEYESKFIQSQENFLEVNGVEYNSFDLAIRDIEQEGTIKVIKSVSVGSSITIPKEKNITVDLNGYTLNTSQRFINYGTLIVKDSSVEQTGKIFNNRTNLFYNYSNMTIENGIYEAASSKYIFYNTGVDAILTINNSKLKNSFSSVSYGIYNTAGTVEINNTDLEVTSTGDDVYGIYNVGLFNVNNSNILVDTSVNSNHYSYGIFNLMTFNMNGGSITSTRTCDATNCNSYKKYAYGIYSNTTNANVLSDIYKTTINSSGTGIYHYYGTIASDDSNIISDSTGIYSSLSNVNLLNTDIISQTDAFYCSLNNRSSRSVNIIGGTLTAGNYGVYLDGYYYTSSSIYYVNAKIGDADNKTIINSQKTGIYLDEYSRITINNAEIISSEANGIYSNSTTNTLTIGENNLSVEQDSPSIFGNTYGINVNVGTFNFYDGIVGGKINAFLGSVTSIPEATVIKTIYKAIDDYDYECKYIDEQDAFLEVDGVEYNSFDIAIRNIESEGTIKVIKTASVGSAATIPNDKIITLDLNGFTLNTTQSIINNGTLIVKDSSTEKTGKIFNTKSNIFKNYSEMIIDNGFYESSTNYYVISNSGVDANLIINNSIIKNKYSGVSYGIYNNAGTVEMNNTDLEVSSTGDDAYGIYNVGLFNVNNSNIIVDTSVNSSYYAYGILNNLTLNMSESSVTATRTCDATNCNSYKKYAYGIYSNTTNANVLSDIYKTTINSSGTGIYHYYGTIASDDSNIISDSTGIYSSLSNVNLLNTDIISQTDAFYCSLNNRSSRSVNIIGGTLTAGNYGVYLDGYYYTSSSIYYVNAKIGDADNKTIINSQKTGIYLDEYSRITINNAEIISSEANGIYSNSTTNTLTLGENNLTIKNDVPVIIGETYGLNVNAGVVNFYDGILKGKTNAYKGAITTIPTDMKVASGTEIINDYVFEIAYISAVSDLFMNKTTGVKYKQLTDAISEANNGEKIVFLDNVQIYENISVDLSKDIIIDLDGYILNLGAHIFTNNGRLTINNTSEKQSKIIKTGENSSFVNNGNLYINSIDFDQFSSYYIFKNNANANLNIENSNIDSVYGVNNLEGYLFLNNVNINATNTAITNKGNMNIDSGTINGSTYAIYDNGVRESVVKNVSVISSGTALYNTNLSVYNLENVIIKGTLSNNNSLGKISHSIGSVEGYIYNYGTINFTELDISGTTTKTSLWVMISNSGTMIVNDCTIITTRTSNYSYETHSIHNYSNLELNNTMLTIGNLTTSGVDVGVFNEGGNVFLSDSAIKVNNVATAYGVYNYNASSKVVMESGSIIANNATNSYGIYMKDGNVTIGVETEPSDPTYGTSRANVSITDPSITAVGTTKGIGVKKEKGYFNYYDGIITGSTNAKPDITSQVEYNYEVTFYKDSDTGYEYTILEYMK